MLTNEDQTLLSNLTFTTEAASCPKDMGRGCGIWLAGTNLDSASAYDGGEEMHVCSASDCTATSSWYWYEMHKGSLAETSAMSTLSLGAERGEYPWNDAEPNDFGPPLGEHCLFLWADLGFNGRWNDFACSTRHSFLCEAGRKNPPALPASPSPPSLG